MAVSGDSFIFDYFLIIEVKPSTKSDGPRELQQRYQFPKEVSDPDEKKFITSAPVFAFPDKDELVPHNGAAAAAPGVANAPPEPDRFSFVNTADSGGRRFGYCVRPHLAGKPFPVACVVISGSPCFALFSKILDEVIARINMTSDPTVIDGFLEAIYPNKLPAPGQLFCVKVPSPWRKNTLDLWRFTRPDDFDTPLEYIDFQPLLRALSAKSIFRIYTSLLLERRMIFISKSLQTLTACVQACAAMLYPFEWQHVFIPLLPKQMMTFVCAPMPFIVGLLEPFLNDLVEYLEMLEEVVIVNLDKDQFQVSHKSPECKFSIRSSYDDRSLVPPYIMEPLLAPIKVAKKQNKKQLSATATKESFLEGFLGFCNDILLNCNDYFDVDHEDGFQKNVFAEEATESLKPFLGKFVKTQMFEQFIMVRVAQYFSERKKGERPDLVDLYKNSLRSTRFTKYQMTHQPHVDDKEQKQAAEEEAAEAATAGAPMEGKREISKKDKARKSMMAGFSRLRKDPILDNSSRGSGKGAATAGTSASTSSSSPFPGIRMQESMPSSSFSGTSTNSSTTLPPQQHHSFSGTTSTAQVLGKPPEQNPFPGVRVRNENRLEVPISRLSQSQDISKHMDGDKIDRSNPDWKAGDWKPTKVNREHRRSMGLPRGVLGSSQGDLLDDSSPARISPSPSPTPSEMKLPHSPATSSTGKAVSPKLSPASEPVKVGSSKEKRGLRPKKVTPKQSPVRAFRDRGVISPGDQRAPLFASSHRRGSELEVPEGTLLNLGTKRQPLSETRMEEILRDPLQCAKDNKSLQRRRRRHSLAVDDKKRINAKKGEKPINRNRSHTVEDIPWGLDITNHPPPPPVPNLL